VTWCRQDSAPIWTKTSISCLPDCSTPEDSRFLLCGRVPRTSQTGERRTEDGERRTEDGERRTENGGRRTENGERRGSGSVRMSADGSFFRAFPRL